MFYLAQRQSFKTYMLFTYAGFRVKTFKRKATFFDDMIFN